MKMRLLLLVLLSLIGSSQEIGQNVDVTDIPELQNIDPNLISEFQDKNANQEAGSNQEIKEVEDSLVIVDDAEAFQDEYGDKFGYDFFQKIPTTISPTGDLPVPNDYIISLKDQIFIIISGSRNRTYTLEVQLNGSILFPEIGSISVAGLTVKNARDKIANLVKNTYVGANLELSVKNLSAKKITLVGAVKFPGTYLVNPFSTITSSLAYAGGVESYGSLRAIKLIKPNGEEHIFDLYDLLIKGKRIDDIVVGQGDTILVSGTGRFISIQGEVVRPGVYEYKEGDNLKDVVNFALGLKGSANRNKIAIDIVDDTYTLVTREVAIDDNFSLNGIRQVSAFPIEISRNLGVLATGPMLNSGFYAAEKYKTLDKLINNLNFTNNLYPYFAILEKQNFKDLKKDYTFFNLRDPDSFKGIELSSNDKIIFLDQDNYADVSERDLRPETISAFNSYKLSINYNGSDYFFPVFGKYNINDFISQLGINFQEIDLSRILITDGDLNSTSISLDSDIYMREDQKIALFNKSKLEINGPVNIRGKFELSEEKDLSELLTFITPDENIFPFIGVVENFNPETLELSSHLFSLEDKETQQIKLNNYSKVFLFSRENYLSREIGLSGITRDLIDSYVLNISFGNTKFNFPVFGSFSVERIINYLGLDDSNIIKDQSTYVKPLDQSTLIFNYETQKLNASKFHSLSLRATGSDLIVVNIAGEVGLPGTYTVSSNRTLQEIYEIAGGFTDDADKEAVILLRESVRESQIRALEDARQSLKEYILNNAIGNNQSLNASLLTILDTEIDSSNLGRIGGDLSFGTNDAKSLRIEDQDFIFIPKKQNIVSVIGEVLNPNALIFNKDKSFRGYINNAGGYKEFALENGVYIIRSNGLVEKVKKGIFRRAVVKPGDTIVVPRDLSSVAYYLPAIVGVADIISNLALTAASVNAITD